MLFGEGPQIKNIAADLNKLFRQGSLLNQIGQTVEGDSTADQGTSNLLAAMDPVIQEISVGMSGEQSARYTVSGTPPLSLPNSLGKPLKAWSVDVLPNQEGTGDPAPDNVRPIHGTDKLNLFVEESYDQSASPKAVLTLPQTVYTGTIGSDGGESRWNEYILDGSADEDWKLQSINQHGIANFYYSITPYKLRGTPNGICNMFTQQTSSISSTTTEGWLLAAGEYLYIRISADKASTDSQFKTWLASNNLQFVYELATPTEFAVISDPIPTPTGTATAWATAEDGIVDGMEVAYVGKA